MKKINEQKLAAFTIGAMGKRGMSRKEQEELKKKEEEEAAAHVFKEFVETFQEPTGSSLGKVWVKAGTYDAGSRKEDNREKGKLYKPTLKLEQGSDPTSDRAMEYAKMLASDSKKEQLSLKKKAQEKKKSNLELFKEELRQIQEEREERHKFKGTVRSMLPSTEASVPETTVFPVHETSGSFDNGDPNTTNLYLGNLNPKISEQQLMELFGKFGPLASIKIMWPRSEEEKSRGRNCGFVAYMSRKDAERALRSLNGKDIMNYEMKLGWGKSVPIMTHPIYIPQVLIDYSMPPPPSGLPFNAQAQPQDLPAIPKMSSKDYVVDPELRSEMDKVLFKSIIKVVVPNERPLLMLIHRMIEFVIREGPMFEAIIMNREIDNPMYRFLFENESPAHTYYRWKLFSLLQGDTPSEWRQKEFRMFAGGSIWKPPPTNFYTQGMPEELMAEEDMCEPNKGALSLAQRDRLEDLIRHLTPERSKIGDAMIFCIEHADAADEICECIAESLSSPETAVHKKIARLYLVSDILNNCTVKVQNASFFRKSMEKNLEDMFLGMNASYMALESRLKAEGFKVRVMNVFRAWEDWAVYSRDFLKKLQNLFLGLPTDVLNEEIDGAPLSDNEKEDEDLDGVPLDGAALLKGALMRGIPDGPISKTTPSRLGRQDQSDDDYDDDIDGVPLDEDIDGVPLDMQKSGAFIPSKWETIDPDQVEAQAITTSKWETLEQAALDPSDSRDDAFSDSDEMFDVESGSGRDLDEDRRTRLREIEVKTMQYQDEIESGKKCVKSGWTMGQQVEHYRRKLIKKSEREMVRIQQDSDSSDKYEKPVLKKEIIRRSVSPVEVQRKAKKSRRSPTPEYYKSSPVRSSKTQSHRSRSPVYTKRDKSRESIEAALYQSTSRSAKSKRARSRSPSESPKRYFKERSPSPVVRVSKYQEASPPRHRYRSPSPQPIKEKSSSRYSASASSSSASRGDRSRSHRELSPVSRHRTDRHKHKHKY